MSGDSHGRESTEKERDGEAKLQGLALAGRAAKALLGGPLARMWRWGRNLGRDGGMLESRGGTWALAGAVSRHGVAGTILRWMDAQAALSPSMARHTTPPPPPCSKGKGSLKLGFSRL